jgi:hypothetical protein
VREKGEEIAGDLLNNLALRPESSLLWSNNIRH